MKCVPAMINGTRRLGSLFEKCTLFNQAMRGIWYFSALLALLALGNGAASAQSALDIVRKSVENDQLNTDRAKDYTYLQRTVTRELDKQGKVTRTKITTHDVIRLGGRPYRKLVAEDDRPLVGEKARKEQERFDREVAKRGSETGAEQKKRQIEEERGRVESRRFLREIPEAFTFELKGEEKVDGLVAWVVEATPKAGYRGKVKNWEMLTKFRGRLWIARGDYQWAKVEAETVAPVSFGWVLAKLEKGARLTFEQRRVNEEVWLPVHATTKIDARLALLKKLRMETDVEWKQFRKFQAESKVVDVSEKPE